MARNLGDKLNTVHGIAVTFDTLTFDHPTACRPARVSASLHLPEKSRAPAPCMVILTTSAGVQRHREHYYAQTMNEAGTAAWSSTVSAAGACVAPWPTRAWFRPPRWRATPLPP